MGDFSAGPVQLFNNRDLKRQGDLRGGRPLTRDHVIDWDVFYPKNEFEAELSLKIDSKVTPVVFDLPESAIPDATKTVGNLPFRNLTRERSIWRAVRISPTFLVLMLHAG
jgi:hypothetical protein